jgi:hypothetical protein
MARKQVEPTGPVPPPVIKPTAGKAINLYLYKEDIQAIDEIRTKMGGSRSDAIRWLISLTGYGPKNSSRKPKSLS